MKSIIFFLALILLSSFMPADTDGMKLSIPFIIGILIAVYEAVSRLIPTSKVWSLVGKVLEILNWISQKLDRKSH